MILAQSEHGQLWKSAAKIEVVAAITGVGIGFARGRCGILASRIAISPMASSMPCCKLRSFVECSL